MRIFHPAAKATHRKPMFVCGGSLETPIVHYSDCVLVDLKVLVIWGLRGDNLGFTLQPNCGNV